jgi:hypothetical protein
MNPNGKILIRCLVLLGLGSPLAQVLAADAGQTLPATAAPAALSPLPQPKSAAPGQAAASPAPKAP